MTPIPDSTLLHSDHLLKRMAIIAGLGIVVGITLYRTCAESPGFSPGM